MRDDHVIPCIAVLMAQDNKMIGHRVAAIWRFKPIAQLNWPLPSAAFVKWTW
jgi:hypothetical protein